MYPQDYILLQSSSGLQQVNRRFFDYDRRIILEDSGYYFDPQDRRLEQPLRNSLNLTDLVSVACECDTQMMCGIPCFNHRWCETREDALWLPREQPVVMPGETKLELLNKTVLADGYRVKYYFKLTGPSRMSVFVKPLDGCRMLDWSFLKGMLDNPATFKPPYHIFFAWAADDAPVVFYLLLAVSIAAF